LHFLQFMIEKRGGGRRGEKRKKRREAGSHRLLGFREGKDSEKKRKKRKTEKKERSKGIAPPDTIKKGKQKKKRGRRHKPLVRIEPIVGEKKRGNFEGALLSAMSAVSK